MALEEVVQRSRPAVMQKRLAAAHSQKRRRVEFSVAHFVGQIDVESLRRGVCWGDMATVALVLKKDIAGRARPRDQPNPGHR